MTQHSERDFVRIIPKILVDNGGTCNTAELISLVPHYMTLTSDDLACGQRINRSRSEPKYAQIVRNIASHHRPQDTTQVVDLGGCVLTRVPKIDEHGNIRVNAIGSTMYEIVYSLIDTELLEKIPPPRAQANTQNRSPQKRRAIDRDEYARRRAYNAHVGEAGELFALAWLQDYVANNISADAANEVIHVGATRDGLGYDILSIDKNGNPFYVEVKTTTATLPDMPFYMSENERAFFEERASDDDAAVMRVYAFSMKTRTGLVKYPILASELMQDYAFRSTSWIVERKKD